MEGRPASPGGLPEGVTSRSKGTHLPGWLLEMKEGQDDHRSRVSLPAPSLSSLKKEVTNEAFLGKERKSTVTEV